MNKKSQTYDELSSRGLIGALVDKVREKRPKASRNTIYLAFEDASTPARRMIVEVGESLLKQHDEEIAAAQAAA